MTSNDGQSSGVTIAGEFVLEQQVATCVHGTLHAARRVASGAAAGAVAFGRTRASNRTDRQQPAGNDRFTLLISNERDTASSAVLVDAWQRWMSLTLPAQVSCQRASIVPDGQFAGQAFAVLEPVQSVLSDTSNDDDSGFTDGDPADLLTKLAQLLLHWQQQAGPHGAVHPGNFLRTNGGWKLGLPAAVPTDRTIAGQADVYGIGFCLRTLDRIKAINLSDYEDTDDRETAGRSTTDRSLSHENSHDLGLPLRFLISECLHDDPALRPPLSLLAESLLPCPPAVTGLEVSEQGDQRRVTWQSLELAYGNAGSNASVSGDAGISGRVCVCAVPAASLVASQGSLVLRTSLPRDTVRSTSPLASGQPPAASGQAANSLLLPTPHAERTEWKLVSQSGQLCRVGPSFKLSRLPEMVIDRVMVEVDELLVDLRWPQSIHNAVITFNTDHLPQDPADGHVIECCRSAIAESVRIPYDRSKPPTVWLVAFSRENQTGQWDYSAGNSATSQREQHLTRHCRIDYRVVDSRLIVSCSRNVFLPELLLTGRRGTTLPESSTDGQLLAKIPAHTACGPRQPLSIPVRQLDRPFAVKLFPGRIKRGFEIDIRMQSQPVVR